MADDVMSLAPPPCEPTPFNLGMEAAALWLESRGLKWLALGLRHARCNDERGRLERAANEALTPSNGASNGTG